MLKKIDYEKPTYRKSTVLSEEGRETLSLKNRQKPLLAVPKEASHQVKVLRRFP